jgi:cytidylate kinase
VFDELSEETGIDLSDASELDADNVPADEEFDRVMQAPD